MVVEEIAEPEAGPGEVLIDVTAASLNFFDTLALRNKYQYKPDLPFSPGGEIAGTVSRIGAGVSGVAVGDRVVASTRFNGCREKVVVPVSEVSPIPDGVSDVVASGVRITYGTAMHGLKDRGQVKPGETVVVTGASGGAGLAALELAKIMGARVIACASSPDKLAICTAHGADAGIDYSREDLKARLRELTDGAGPDVIYDCVGGEYAEPAFRAIAWEGRYLVVGFAAGEIPKLPLNLTLLKGASLIGVFWGAWTDRHPAENKANIEQVLAWCADGSLEPRIHGTYPLDDIVEALQVIDKRQAVGKVVVVP